jgi:thiamine-phosphate pyrophosphorylase
LEEHLSAAAARVLAAARRSAAGRNVASVEAIDLLVGLLADDDLGSARLLAKHGADLAEFRRRHQRTDGDESAATILDPLVRKIVLKAREFSLGRKDDLEIGTEDLLIAVVEAWTEIEPLLAPFGFSREKFLDATRPAVLGAIAIPPSEPKPSLDTDGEIVPRARAIDANLNRAAEGFRVAEDYCRFVLEDRGLSESLKRARHRLHEAAGFLPDSWRIASRDSPNDVGAELTAEREGRRETALDVAVANIKRVQEALRSLEEFAKIDNSLAARQFGTIRYEAYHLEKLLRIASTARQALESADVYWLAEPDACRKSFEWTAKEVMDAGVVLIQLRQKGVDDRTLFGMAKDLRRWTERFGARLVINDRADVAGIVGADGVHVGQEDLPPYQIRSVVGPNAIIGVSTHTLAQLDAAVRDGADYLGVGPVFPSKSKSFVNFPGLEFVEAAAGATSLPMYCIGGITPNNIGKIIDAGGRKVAVGRAISDSDEPSQVVRRLRSALA